MHVLTKKLLQGLEDLKHNPSSPVVGGVYKQTFDIFVHQTIGDVDLTQPQNIDKAKTLFEQLPSVSGKLEDLEGIYKTAQNQCDFGLHELRLDRNQGMSQPDWQKKSADLIAKSVAHVTIAANLPETHIDNPKIIQRLSGEIYSQKNLGENPNLTTDLQTTINNVVRDSGAPVLENKVTENLANKAATNITGKSGGGINLAILSSAALIVALLNRPSEESSEEANKPETEEKEGGGTGAFGQLAGLGLGAILARRDTDEKETSEQKQPPATPVQPEPAIPKIPVPISVPASTALKSITSSIISSFGGFFKKNLGGLFKKALGWGVAALTGGTSKLLGGALKIGGKLLSFFGGFSRAGQTDTGALLKKSSIAIAFIIIVPLLLILVLSYYIVAVVIPTALVTSTTPSSSGTTSSVSLLSGCQTGVGGGEVCLVSISPVLSVYPTPRTTTGIVPRGFPVSSSCVTQPPGGSVTHSKLNAVDIAPFNKGDILVIRATHTGKVIWVGDLGGYGLAVLLEDNDKRYITYYGHILPGSVKVSLDDQINTGTELGIVDSRGFSTGNHLHYEIRGPRDLSFVDKLWGSKTGEFGEIGTIMNFIPDCKTWSCQWFCNK